MPFHCVIRGGGWRRSSSSSWSALFLYGAATNAAYSWSIFTQYLFNERVLTIGSGQHPAADRLLDGARRSRSACSSR